MNNTQSTDLIFELSRPGRRCHRLPACDVPANKPVAELVPAEHLAAGPPPLPEVGEIDLVRHFTNLSARNMSIDTNFYPLGVCTMKYNPKRHERLAALPGFANLHPLQPDDTCQGMLELLFEMQQYPRRDQRAAGRVAPTGGRGPGGTHRALRRRTLTSRTAARHHRTKVLVPDWRHGTNPASAALAGFDAVDREEQRPGPRRSRRLEGQARRRHGRVHDYQPEHARACSRQIKQITELVHATGALVYLDGANMNAILGVTRPGDFGADMQHYNVHKTFTGPHGGGGPGPGRLPSATSSPRTCRRRSSSRTATATGSNYDLPELDRPGAELLRQRRHPVPRVLLHPHARPATG